MKVKNIDTDAVWDAHKKLRISAAKQALKAAKAQLAKAEADLEKSKAL